MIKGMYIIYPDHDYIEKAIMSGVNTLILASDITQNEKVTVPHREWMSFDMVKESIERYSNMPNLQVVFALTLMPHAFYLPDDQAFHSEKEYYPGMKIYKQTPCPSNISFIENRFNQLKELCHTYNIKFALDLEACNHVSFGMLNPLGIKYLTMTPYKCVCPKCKEKNYPGFIQWLKYAQKIKSMLGNMKDIYFGHYPHSSMWINRYFYTNKCYYMPEFTYWDPRHYKTVWYFVRNKLLAKQSKFLPGAWLERFYGNDYIKHLESLIKNPLNKGYWIYPQRRMSRSSPIDLSYEWTPYYKDLIDYECPTFFEQLKKLNRTAEKLNDWRF